MRRRFGSEYLREEFKHLGDTLETPTKGYLIGGASMAFRGLKDATKDIDLVVRDGESLERFRHGLDSLGYETVQSPREAYAELGTKAILENDDGCRFDLFVMQVVGEVVFTAEMRDRCDPFMETGSLLVELVAPEDIFLFKSVAGRTDDIDDMNTLVQTGLDFEAIEAEIDRQIEQRSRELFVTRIDESLGKLEQQFGVRTPIGESVAERAEAVYQQLEVLMALESPLSISALEQSVAVDGEELKRSVDRLEDKGAIRKEDEKIVKRSEEI